MAALAAGCCSLTSGVENGWTSPMTLGCVVACVAAVLGFVIRERAVAHPMIDLSLLAHRTVRGSALAQMGASVAQMAVVFLLILHLQDALGWSALEAGLGNLPFVITMIAASPLADGAIARLGHRVTCSIAAGLLVAGLLELAWATPHGYWAMVPGIVVLTAGLRVIRTVCAVALIESVPEDRSSLGTALGTAVVGTVIAALVAGYGCSTLTDSRTTEEH